MQDSTSKPATERCVLDSLAQLAADANARGPMARVLAATERWNAEELDRHQRLRLGKLLAHARANVPFYAGLPGLAKWSPELFRELPILSRETLRDRCDELLSRSVPRAHRIVREANSSGSTGKHVTVKIDAVCAAMGEALALRDHRWHGRDLRLKAAGIRAIESGAGAPYGKREPRWSCAAESGPLVLLDVHTPVREQLDWLLRESPAYLATYASNASALVSEAERAGVSLPGLLELGTFGEVVPDDLRERCRRVLGVPLVDAYSTVELGSIALQCPDGPRYHLQSEHLLVEILREDGLGCEPGETGRVVVTALHAFAMPLIRYDVGDYATVGGPCACGRGLPVIERILGRARNMLRLPNGDVLWPRYASIVLGKLFPLRQFRLVQVSLRELVLEVVATRPLLPDEERRLRSLVLDTLGYAFDLTIVHLETIARSPSGKFEDFVCRIDRAE